MKEVPEIYAVFLDHEGLYYALAKKLSQAYKKVDYYDPNVQAFDTVNEAMIGDSHPEDPRLERIDEYEFWKRKNQYDLFIMPDSKEAGLQTELAGQGKKIWGSQRSSFIEHSRETFVKILEDVGFDVPKHQRIVGLSNLRKYLKDRENEIIKISRFRGTMETYKWIDYDEGEAWLDMKAVQLGGVKELFPFMVFESIDTPFELGGDTINVRGKFPKSMLDGYEWKDKGYFAAWKPVVDMPPQTQAVMEVFAPILAKTNHANFWSMEIRVKDEQFHFIDPTPRGPLPALASQMEIITNLPAVIAAGAEGELLEPEASAPFSVECVLTLECKAPEWPSVRIPPELEQSVKLGGVCTVNGRSWFPPVSNDHGNEIGWLVAIGSTPAQAIDRMLELKRKLPEKITAHTESLIDLLKEIRKAEDEGIEFTPKPVPPPEYVVTSDQDE